LERRIRDERGVVRPLVNIFVGDDNVRSLSGVGTLLSPGDDVSILPAISGGDHPGGGDYAGDGT
jgi:molybdopterin converting factor small subunit